MKTLIPDINKNDNPWMYCNYARMNRFYNPCKNCKNEKCEHKGKETNK
jgi:hypothetical protein